tara:strand:+ start:10787 stop:12001 length:1215 start_codon:yes stop_codon:yes gene_type:complete
MSRLYAENNNENTRSLFEKKNAYRFKLISQEQPNIVNFNLGEKYFYGRTNQVFIPIVFRNRDSNPIKLKLFDGRFLAEPDSRLGAANFVVDAFNDMAQQFRKCAQTGRIRPNDPFLTDLQIFKAYQDSTSLYAQHQRTYAKVIAEQFVADNIKVKNFDEFVAYLMELMKKSAPRYAFTKTGYIKSRYCPIACSALAIEIADIDVTNDLEKITEFVNSPNWDFYVQTCNSYGFMIDEKIPWRIVADIDSEGMQQYAEKYGIVGGTTEILSFGYEFTHAGYYANRFKYDLYNLYNAVRKKHFRETSVCGNGKLISKMVYPRSYPFDELLYLYSDQYFLDLYFKIRTMEEEAPPAPDKLYRLYQDCHYISAQSDVFAALETFEQILNKPFDIRGSLSYISKHIAANR